MFYVKLSQAQRPLFVFTYFQADGVRFFVCRWVAVRVGAGFALFFATPLPFGRLGNCMFPSKVCRRSVVFFVCGVFSRKMCCKRFLLMRFCTTLFALFHVRKQFNVAFVNVDVSGNKKACFLQVVLCKRVLQCTAYRKTQGDEKPFSQRCVCDIMFFEVITIHTGKMR